MYVYVCTYMHVCICKQNFGNLYDVYAQASPTSALQLIGSVVQKSAFVGSQYGDRNLFFQHSRFEDDLKVYPQWNADARNIINAQASADNYVFPDLPF